MKLIHLLSFVSALFILVACNKDGNSSSPDTLPPPIEGSGGDVAGEDTK